MQIALDPGLNSPGIAMFGERDLIAATRFNTEEHMAELHDGERWLQIARVLAGWSLKLLKVHQPELLTIVFERPQVYGYEKSKGDPNKLVSIAGVAANLTGILSVYGRITVASPHPRDWIGQLSKKCTVCHKNLKKCPECKGSAWNTPRGRRIRSRLSPTELALVPDQNDAIDAVGLGLWNYGRLEPRSTFSNGRDGR